MELYRQLSLPFDPLVDMHLQPGARQARLQLSEANPEVLIFLQEAGLNPYYVDLFYVPPGFSTDFCHSDLMHLNADGSFPSASRLSWVVNAPEAKMKWYSVPDGVKKKFASAATTVAGAAHMLFPTALCQEIASINMNGWFLVDPGTPHAVFNPSSQHRWCVSFQLKDEKAQCVPYEEALKKLPA